MPKISKTFKLTLFLVLVSVLAFAMLLASVGTPKNANSQEATHQLVEFAGAALAKIQ